MVDVSHIAVAFQPGVECNARGKISIWTRQGMAVAEREQHKRNIDQNSIIRGHRFVPFAVETPSRAMGSEAVALVKMLGQVMKQRRQRPYLLCVRETYERLVCHVQLEYRLARAHLMKIRS